MREDKLPLRVILQNFVNHVESLENVKEENERDEKYEHEFQDLKKLTESLKNHPDFTSSEGERECNRRKNRYKDILPYDRTRVILQPFPGVPGSDYINANYIRGASGSRAYIASQGPLLQTVPDFWRMVVECDVQVIVMASNETEGGKHKCECYWTSTEGEEKQFGNVTVTFVKSRQVCPDFLVRTLKISYLSDNNKMEERTICQFHYMLWPDHGVPDAVRPLLDMVRLVRDCQASETLPVLIHCSAGCGRTGTICAIDYVWGLLRTGKLSVNLNLLSLVREMRVQRVAMVQTKEQYMLLYRAVKELFRERLSLIDAHPYENVSTDGNPIKEKESDYEELFVTHEKQDQSMKIITPSSTSSNTTPSSSLTRKPSKHQTQTLDLNTEKDNLRRSASATNLHSQQSLSRSGQLFSTPFTGNPSSLSLNVNSRSEDQIMKISHLLTVPSERSPRISLSPSKMAKEVENLAQRNECCRVAPDAVPLGDLLKQSPLELNSPLLLSSSLSPPMPPPRSRTPSPLVTFKKEGEKAKSELSRRPSIKKLREMFEGSRGGGESPRVVKLSRSASSVTTRPSTLSLRNDHSLSLKVKRKGSLSSEKLPVCSPPPETPNLLHPRTTGKPPSSPTINTRRKLKEEKGEDRPALPIKKSKSFRWARPQGMGNIFKGSRSPELPRKRAEDNYFLPARSEENLRKLSNDIPVRNEGLKLSVYSRTGSVKPDIPPKKSIGDKLRNPPSLYSEPSMTTPGVFNSPEEDKFLPYQKFVSNEGCAYPRSKIDFADQSVQNSGGISKDYVNAKLLRTTTCENDRSPKHHYVPIPTKRKEKPKMAHEYVNCNLKSKSEDDSSLSDCANVSDSSIVIESTFTEEREPPAKVNSDYELVDFGESSSHVDEVFETMNYELLNKNEAPPKESSQQGAFNNYYLNRELDSIAIEVYKDCQNYLLHGTNKSAVPSLLPKERGSDGALTNLEEVRNKVAVPPQGLRSRERRNSYRQAVSSTSYNKGGHKYEKIWFESGRENFCDNELLLSNQITSGGALADELSPTEGGGERKKLVDLSEEEISSRESGSTSSLFSSEKLDPFHSMRPRLPSPSRSSSNSALLGSSSSLGSSSVAAQPGTSSQYGTLATTTSKPYKAKTYSSPDKIPPFCDASTLPSRSHSTGPSKASYSAYETNPEYIYGYSGSHNYANISKVSPNDRIKTSKSGSNLPVRGFIEGNEKKLSNFANKYTDASDCGTKYAGVPHQPKQSHSSFSPFDHQDKIGRPASQDISQYKDDPKYKELDDLDYRELNDRRKVASVKTCHQPLPLPSSRFYVNHSERPSRHVDDAVSPPSGRKSQNTSPSPASSHNSPSSFLKLFKGKGGETSFRRSVSPSPKTSSRDAAMESPKPLVKAFGKLRTGSRNVAQNLKSYIKGGSEDLPRRPLQKSASYGPSINVFSEVVQDSACSTPVPKNPYGPQEENYHSDDPSNRSKPRQQYL